MSYEQFKEFYEKHPDMDNAEYYAEFPETNKSTVRSWKTRLNKPIEIPEPTPAQVSEAQGFDEEMVKLLCTQTKTPYNEFEGVDTKSAMIVLKAKLKNMQLQEMDQKPNRSSNAPILPNPTPIGQNVKKFGIDPYITFDKLKDEIRMEIPWDVLMNPEKNKALGEVTNK